MNGGKETLGGMDAVYSETTKSEIARGGSGVEGFQKRVP